MTQTEAQKRAQQKYKSKFKSWEVRIPPDMKKALDDKQKKKGLTKKQVLEHFLKEE